MFDSFIPILPYFLFCFGALLGSFGNVVIYRLPRNESVVRPRSRCQSCKAPVAWYDNIPIFSWFILRGKCRSCGCKYSFRYPLVELLMAGLFLAAYLYVGLQWVLIEYLIFIFGLVIVTFIDIDHFILPDVFTLGGIVVGLLGAAFNPDRSFSDSFIGVVIGGGFLWAIAYFYFLLRKEEGLGGGDIKLLGWIGAVLGWKAIPMTIISSSLIGSVFGLVAATRGGKGMKTVIPFGPYLALGALLYIFGGEGLGKWYLSLFLPSLEQP